MSDQTPPADAVPESSASETPPSAKPTPAAKPSPKPAPAAAAAKKKPAAKDGGGDAPVSRRSFLATGIGWGVFTAAMLGCSTAFTRFLFPNVLVEPPSEFKVGFPADFQIGEVDERFKDRYGIWIVRDAGGLYALSTTCTHLGCTPNWLKTEDKFKCPCHGSGFYRTGINFEGPAPRPLERYSITLAVDGQIQINKNRILQQEKGQWEDPEAYLKLV